MNEILRNMLLVLVAAAFATGCSPSGAPGGAVEPPLAGSSIGGDFTLIDENGDAITRQDFAGRYLVVYFGYTFCPDVCPLDMQKLGAGLRVLEARNLQLAEKIVPLFVSVDPGRDTPEVLEQFTANFHPRLIGATGTREQIDAMTERYGVYYALGDDDGSGNYLVNHSANVLLFNPEGDPLAIIPTDIEPEAVADEIERWAR